MSAIEWTDESFAPWFGCTKISPACDHCYAESWTVARFKKAEWGPRANRVRAAASTWAKPAAWERKARKLGRPLFVFCSELSDVFDNQVPDEWRSDLWDLIESTPSLVWLLLTKRPQNVMRMIPAHWRQHLPQHVWLGTTAENQLEADRRVPVLCTIPAARSFLSCEPLLGPINLGVQLGMVHWIIAGAESGRGARPMHLDWVRGLRDQCAKAGTAFFYKQDVDARGHKISLPELDGRRWSERPEARP